MEMSSRPAPPIDTKPPVCSPLRFFLFYKIKNKYPEFDQNKVDPIINSTQKLSYMGTKKAELFSLLRGKMIKCMPPPP